jgi:hypothetical protein
MGQHPGDPFFNVRPNPLLLRCQINEFHATPLYGVTLHYCNYCYKSYYNNAGLTLLRYKRVFADIVAAHNGAVGPQTWRPSFYVLDAFSPSVCHFAIIGR